MTPEWIDCGNDEFSTVVYETGQEGNYKSVVVRKLHGHSRWRIEVNGAYRGGRKMRSEAQADAIHIAMAEYRAAETPVIADESGKP